MRFQGLLISVVFASAAFFGCESTKKERPSPLRSDSTRVGMANVKIEFSSPAVHSRAIWGDLVAYDRLWRTGANEATVLSTTNAIKLAGVKLDSGKYAVFTRPSASQWTFILNEHWNQWGTYNYDSTYDVLRVLVVPRQTNEFSERMRFYFEDDSLKFHWEKLAFSLPLE
jgi:hypothetical protein